MEKKEEVPSYLDWELQFKGNPKGKIELDSEDSIKNLRNSLGIEKEMFKTFLKKWKRQNL
jgi:hypothetical protein